MYNFVFEGYIVKQEFRKDQKIFLKTKFSMLTEEVMQELSKIGKERKSVVLFWDRSSCLNFTYCSGIDGFRI
jgi:hypothetical protein